MTCASCWISPLDMMTGRSEVSSGYLAVSTASVCHLNDASMRTTRLLLTNSGKTRAAGISMGFLVNAALKSSKLSGSPGPRMLGPERLELDRHAGQAALGRAGEGQMLGDQPLRDRTPSIARSWPPPFQAVRHLVIDLGEEAGQAAERRLHMTGGSPPTIILRNALAA